MWLRLRNVEMKKKKKRCLSFPPPWELQTPSSSSRAPGPPLLLGDPQLPINLPRNWLSQFFLELFLHWCPVAYWAPTNLESSSFSVISFCHFITVHGILKIRILKWFAIPFSSGPQRFYLLLLSYIYGPFHSFQSALHNYFILKATLYSWCCFYF